MELKKTSRSRRNNTEAAAEVVVQESEEDEAGQDDDDDVLTHCQALRSKKAQVMMSHDVTQESCSTLLHQMPAQLSHPQ